ncbi:hypothetical protein L615_005000000300 [Nocardioides sp. J9]|uniref:hypothetical protein n=1 Tax=unclassified Nocardioides TaxID=2615069 RepID=UPI00048C7F5E|nr:MULTISPECIES: hypothetical protein [unclassified Nocardioides]TWG95009.1 hypothetical protein L615_005000000300 [Nocardioides sp. J9]
MKRLLVLSAVVPLVATFLVITGAPPARAANSTTVVNGFDYPSSLTYIELGCETPSASEVYALYRRGGARGTHATGFRFEAADTMAGALGRVSSPSTLHTATVRLYFPDPGDNDTVADGYFVVRYTLSGGEAFVGYHGLTAPGPGGAWVTSKNLATVQLGWVRESDGEFLGYNTVAGFTQGTVGTAQAGVAFGCDGRDYYIDDLRLSSAAGTSSWDFEGARSRSYISATPTHHSERLERDIIRLRLVHGQDHHLLGDSAGVPDGVVGNAYIAGTARLHARGWNKASFRRIGTASYTATTYAHFRIKPSRQTRYQVRTVPTSPTFENSSSKILLVTVQRRVRSRVADTRIRRGQRIVVSGHVLPRDRGVGVTLQRRVNGTWRAVGRATTGRSGGYVVGVRARSVGKWVVRVKVASAKGNVGNVSRPRTVRVTPPPPKPSPAPAPVTPVVDTTPIPPTHSVVPIKRPVVGATVADTAGPAALSDPVVRVVPEQVGERAAVPFARP